MLGLVGRKKVRVREGSIYLGVPNVIVAAFNRSGGNLEEETETPSRGTTELDKPKDLSM
jgi:hypothetical protein